MVSYAAPLTRPPLGLALLEERAGALLRVVGVQHALAVRLGEQLGLVERQPEALADGEPRAAHRERRVAVDHLRELPQPVAERVVLDHLGDQAELVRALPRSCAPACP